MTASPSEAGAPEPLGPLAWTALVARWVAVAQASRAAKGADPRLAASVAPLVTIEATTAALGELASIDASDRPHARAVAELAIRRAAGELDRLWRGEEWPDELHAACEAAERALALAVYAGLEEFVVAGDGAIEVPALDLGIDGHGADAAPGTLAAMPPGTIAMPGEPVAWWCGREAPVPPAGAPPLLRRRARAPRQVYRGLDERGHFTEDTVVALAGADEGELLAGLPLLTPLLVDGARVGRFLQPEARWLEIQRRALAGRARLVVAGLGADGSEPR
jgi:hypothetical protein